MDRALLLVILWVAAFGNLVHGDNSKWFKIRVVEKGDPGINYFLGSGDKGTDLADMISAKIPLRLNTPDGYEIGSKLGLCTITTAMDKDGDPEYFCTVNLFLTQTLLKGQLTAQGVFPRFLKNKFKLPVAAGTDDFAGARGYIVGEKLAATTWQFDVVVLLEPAFKDM